MTKNEFLSRLKDELTIRQIADRDDIVNEYEQHFAYKLADGFPEEEVVAKLGDPVMLAAQFEPDGPDRDQEGSGRMARVIFALISLPVALLLFLLILAGIVLLASSLAFGGLAVVLLGGIQVSPLIPTLPYWTGAIFGISLASLSVLLAVGCFYYAAFIRQLTRSYGRFRHNTIASASGQATLPGLAIHPQLGGRIKRRLRLTALLAFTLCAISFTLAFLAAVLTTGSFEFWHSWNWFTKVPVG